MEVKATARGVYGRFREAGEVFDIIDEAHLGSWMEPTSAADRGRLAGKLIAFKKQSRAPAGPDVPATTALSSGMKQIPMPKAPVKKADEAKLKE